jgi:hypothetical protein
MNEYRSGRGEARVSYLLTPRLGWVGGLEPRRGENFLIFSPLAKCTKMPAHLILAGDGRIPGFRRPKRSLFIIAETNCARPARPWDAAARTYRARVSLNVQECH